MFFLHTNGISFHSQIAVIGFCFGGMCALDMARSDLGLKGAVSFHGTFTPPEYTTPDTIQTKILVCHGDADFHIPPEQVKFAKNILRIKTLQQLQSVSVDSVAKIKWLNLTKLKH